MSTKGASIDLSQVDNQDHEELAKRIEDYYRADTGAKSALAYHWEKNHLYLDGKQWIVYDNSGGRAGNWKGLQVSKENEYIPRPVTNYIYDIYQTLKSYLIQHQPRSTIIPNTLRYEDKQSAAVGELILECNWERLKEEYNYEYAAACGVAYGSVFKKDYWDNSTIQMAKVPRMEEQPVIDPATGTPVGYEEREVRDPETGEAVYDEIPLGDVNTSVVEPYRIALDPMATDLHNAAWVMEFTIQPLDWIRETYGVEDEGYTGLADTVEPEKSLSNELRKFYQLKNSSGTKLPGSPQIGGSQGQDEMLDNAAVVKEYYSRPTRNHPRGRMVVVANGVTLYAGDSPYSGPEMGDWHPYSEFRWEVVPGRFWGKSPLDDTTEIQKHINSIDATIILVRKTQAIPQKLVPGDSGVKPGEWTGRPGQEIRTRAGGSLPSTIPAAGVDAQVFQERAQKVEDLKQISGAIDILKGDRPPGVNAASALELLFEVGTGKIRPSLNRWKRFVENSQKKQLKWTAKFYREPRPEFVRLLQSKNKEIPVETIENFIGSDLRDNCNVKIEAGANIPKLQSAEKAQLLQLAQIGTLNLEDPANKMEFNRRMGVVGFDNEVGPDARRAQWENSMLDSISYSPDNRPILLVDDNHDVHLEYHIRRMKEPSFISLPQEVIEAYQAHIEEHQQQKSQQEQMEMEKAAVTGQPPAPKGQPSPPRGAGPGIKADTREQVFSPDVPKLGG